MVKILLEPKLYHLSSIMVGLYGAGQGPVWVDRHVVELAVLVLHWVVNVLPALQRQLVPQLRPSVSPLHHSLDLARMHDTSILSPHPAESGGDVLFPDPAAAVIDHHCTEAQLQGVEGC